MKTNQSCRFIWVIAVVSLFFVTLPDESSAKMYKWIDKEGKTHFTDHPGNIPMDSLDNSKPIKGVYGTPDPKQYHREDEESKKKRREEFRKNVERQKRVDACERRCQSRDLFDTITCIQSKCRGVR